MISKSTITFDLMYQSTHLNVDKKITIDKVQVSSNVDDCLQLDNLDVNSL